MGNSNGKKGNESLFSAEEQKILEAAYRSACKHAEKVTEDNLLASWNSALDEYAANCTANYLFQCERQRAKCIQYKRFAEPYYFINNGTISEKTEFLTSCLRTGRNEITLKELEYYATSILKSFMNMETLANSAEYRSWKERGYQSSERTISSFAKGLIRTLDKDITENSLERWLHMTPLFVELWKDVMAYVYSGQNLHKMQQLLGGQSRSIIIPECAELPMERHYTPILELPQIMFINGQLPLEHRHRWRFLFSSKIMGQSFSTLLGKIQNKGATLIIIEDEDHYIFGGFAPEAWALRPKFVGNDTSMLFTLSPAMRAFSASNFNNHYQYLNLHQQTMPNGLGMGGQFEYWGLWLDSDYGIGQSAESCSTFQGYVQLSKRKDFRIRNLEVWGIGDLPKDEDDLETESGSVLDRNKEDQVMLELAGKTLHSEGLRPEPPLE